MPFPSVPKLLALAVAASILAACSQPVKPSAQNAAPPPAEQAPATAPPAPLASQIPLPPPLTEQPFQLRPPPATGQTPITLLLPLTGPQAGIGRMLLDAAQLALIETGNLDIVLLPRDTEGRPERAADLAREAVAGGTALFLGPLLAAEVRAVGDVARPYGIPVVGFSTDRSVAGDGVYLLSFTPEAQVSRVVRYAAGQGIDRFAALVPQNPYGDAVLAAYSEALAQANGTLAQVQVYPPDAGDLTPYVKQLADYDRRHAELQRVKRELAGKADDESRRELRRLERLDTLGEVDYRAVLVADGGQRLKALAPLLPYYDVDPKEVRFLGTGLWDEAGLGNEPALIGGWFATTPPALADTFTRRFEQAFGRRPPRIASLAYDAVALAAALGRNRQADAFSAAAMQHPDGFAGFNGIFRFTPQGLAQRGLAVLEVTARGFRVVDPAPDSFQVPGQ